MATSFTFAATCPKGVERLLADEIRDLGAQQVHETRAAVTFEGPLSVGYAACLWSRLASRVLLTLDEFPAADAAQLYAGVTGIEWERHLSADGTLAVDATGTSAGLTNTTFTAMKVKDGVVDRLRDLTGRRPSVDLQSPDVRLNVRLHRGRATLSLDLSGEPLHRRGYRLAGEQVEAPLKENLAAAILVRAGWPAVAKAGGALFDPMCGSGTLLIEGALIAGDQAPGLLRSRWGFAGWLGHEGHAWDALVAEADARAEAGRASIPPIAGSDADPGALRIAAACAKRAGLGQAIAFEVADVASASPPPGVTRGLLVANPPYGERLKGELAALYETLGKRMLSAFDGWGAAVFTSDEGLARALGLRSAWAHTFFNGAIETRLYFFEVSSAAVKLAVRPAPSAPSAGAEVFANRLRKNARHIAKWAKREGVTCYRVYDADVPEYAVAVDLYTGAGPDEGRRFAHLAEYAPPATVDESLAQSRLAEAVASVADVLGVAPEDVAVKVRRRQRGTAQYGKQAERGEFVHVAEGGLTFLVNLHDYLDTGLFLDHRPVRAMIRDRAAGTRFLNLFAYTGTASAYAAAGGARSVTTVDLSATYIEWAKRNLAINGFGEGPASRFVRSDVLSWIAREKKRVEEGSAGYDLVFCDPPTYSASKAMGSKTFDVQRDHVSLLRDAASLLAPDGTIVFSTNLRRFSLDAEALGDVTVEDVSERTIPPDFVRSPRIHRCFLIRRA